MPSDPTFLAIALGLGFVTGGLFFAGLWLTTERLATSSHPALLMIASSIIRVGIVLAAFFFAGRGHMDRMLFCLAGFIIARLAIIRISRIPKHENRREPQNAP